MTFLLSGLILLNFLESRSLRIYLGRHTYLEVSSKATRLLNLLRRNMSGCSKQAKSRAYTALVQPQLETSVPIWSPYDKVSCDSIEKVQKRGARCKVGQR